MQVRVQMSVTNNPSALPTEEDTADRKAFQSFLDRTFPRGATCAVMNLEAGHLDEASHTLTGRLVCAEAGRDRDGADRYLVVIDPLSGGDDAGEAVSLWIRHPRRHDGQEHLWQADVVSEKPPSRVLRLNANPPGQWGPTPAMRTAVTEAYAHLLEGGSSS